jgi:hypothetical protein
MVERRSASAACAGAGGVSAAAQLVGPSGGIFETLIRPISF